MMVRVRTASDSGGMTVSQTPQAGARHARHAGLQYAYDHAPGIRRRRHGKHFEYFDSRGKRITTVKKCRFDAEVVGATYVDEPVVVDGNIICARTWHDNHLWMREFMKKLNLAR